MVLVILIGVVSASSALVASWLRTRQECDRLVRLIAPDRVHALVSRLRQWPPREMRGLAPAVGPATPRG